MAEKSTHRTKKKTTQKPRSYHLPNFPLVACATHTKLCSTACTRGVSSGGSTRALIPHTLTMSCSSYETSKERPRCMEESPSSFFNSSKPGRRCTGQVRLGARSGNQEMEQLPHCLKLGKRRASPLSSAHGMDSHKSYFLTWLLSNCWLW